MAVIAQLITAVALFTIYSCAFAPKAWCGQSITPPDESEPKSVVVFAATNIPEGAVIGERAVHESVINSRGYKDTDILSRDSIIGRRARYGFVPGQLIMEHNLLPKRKSGTKKSSTPTFDSTFVQAKSTISAGSIIARTDLITGTVKTTDSSRWVKSVDEAVALRASYTIIAGQILTTDILHRGK